MNNHRFGRYVYFVFIMILLVIIAGSVVRVTQSGMGCPDWPKCFGNYIPPTQMEQVLFATNKQYTKGQFIKYNDSLWFAKNNFLSTTPFNYNDWTHYNKHGYTKIVIYQTWIEYINRLLGALLGLFVLVQLVWSFLLRKHNKQFLILSLLLLFLTGFQAWLGKTVVDSNLAVVKISIHLAGAVAMLLLQVIIMHKLKPVKYHFSKNLGYWLYVLSLLTTVHFFLGVIVRQKIDLIAEEKGFQLRGEWINEVGTIFLIHRSSSLLLIGLSFFLFWRYKQFLANALYKGFLVILMMQFVIGILFIYVSFPAFAQTFHLTLSCIAIAILFLILLRKQNESLTPLNDAL
jgi:heme a synthase